VPTLYASFSKLSSAEKAVGDLLVHGVPGSDVHLVANRKQAMKAHADLEVDHASSGVTSAAPPEDPNVDGPGDKALRGLEKLLSVAVRGVGMLIGEGFAGGTVAAAIDHPDHQALEDAPDAYFISHGVPADTALEYEQTIVNGGMVLAVDLHEGRLDPVALSRLLDNYAGSRYIWEGAPLERELPPALSSPPLAVDPVAAMFGHQPPTEA
jgi:hypothetical protein